VEALEKASQRRAPDVIFGASCLAAGFSSCVFVWKREEKLLAPLSKLATDVALIYQTQQTQKETLQAVQQTLQAVQQTLQAQQQTLQAVQQTLQAQQVQVSRTEKVLLVGLLCGCAAIARR
jgi:hypothetical protein